MSGDQPPRKRQVLLADDHTVVREGLKRLHDTMSDR